MIESAKPLLKSQKPSSLILLNCSSLEVYST